MPQAKKGEYTVESILNKNSSLHKKSFLQTNFNFFVEIKNRIKDGKEKYVFQWEGFENPTWEKKTDLKCPALLKEFEMSRQCAVSVDWEKTCALFFLLVSFVLKEDKKLFNPIP